MKRRYSKQIQIGNVKIGGDAPISVQSMCNTDTRDVQATVAQIKELETAGCELIRLAVLNKDAADAIKEIKKKVEIPVIADIHFDYRLAIQCIENGKPVAVEQWEPYRKEYCYTLKEAIGAIVEYLEQNNLDKLVARTGIIIVPSYKFRVVDMLVTNFHQPQSTLLLLISAFVGEGKWKAIYNYALDNGFRFLSYGDSSLLFRGI